MITVEPEPLVWLEAQASCLELDSRWELLTDQIESDAMMPKERAKLIERSLARATLMILVDGAAGVRSVVRISTFRHGDRELVFFEERAGEGDWYWAETGLRASPIVGVMASAVMRRGMFEARRHPGG